MHTFTYWFIILLFLFINFSILFHDILHRIIPNYLLLLLIFLLPIWWWKFSSIGLGLSIILLSLALIILTLGILYHKENVFLGAGDIKYGAILIPFLTEKSVSVFIGNIGVITFATLFIMWSMILGFTFGFGGIKKIKENIQFTIKKSLKTIKKDIALAIFDWIGIGFLLSLLIKDISFGLFQIIPVHTDLYFLLSIGIFLSRSQFRKLILNGKYNIYPLLGIIVYIGNFIQVNSLEIFFQDFLMYLGSIWRYALIFLCTNTIIHQTFTLYDELLGQNRKKGLHTIPFSVVLFMAYICTYFLGLHLIIL